jgi:integrase
MAAEAWLSKERKYLDELVVNGELSNYQTPRERLQSALRVNDLTLGQYIERYRQEKERGGRWRDSTAQRYNWLIENRILPTLEDRPLARVLAADVADWWHSLPADTGRTNTLAYQLLRSVFRAAIRDHLYSGDNPCDIYGASTGSKRREIAPLSAEQVLAISAAMPERLRLSVLLAAFCGAMRSGEVRELRRKDFNMDAGTLTISRQVSVLADGTRVVGAPKTDAGIRTVPIPKALLPVVKAHLHDHAQITDDGLLFYNRHGKQLAPTDLLKAFTTAQRKAGISGYVFHDLRRCWSTFTALGQATKRERMAVGGWATSSMVERYEQVDQPHMLEVTDWLSNRITEAKKASA